MGLTERVPARVSQVADARPPNPRPGTKMRLSTLAFLLVALLATASLTGAKKGAPPSKTARFCRRRLVPPPACAAAHTRSQRYPRPPPPPLFVHPPQDPTSARRRRVSPLSARVSTPPASPPAHPRTRLPPSSNAFALAQACRTGDPKQGGVPCCSKKQYCQSSAGRAGNPGVCQLYYVPKPGEVQTKCAALGGKCFSFAPGLAQGVASCCDTGALCTLKGKKDGPGKCEL